MRWYLRHLLTMSMRPVKAEREIDASGLDCPLPILRAKRALATMESGQLLKIHTTDPRSQRDFAAFAEHTGNRIVQCSITPGKKFLFVIRRR